MFIDKENLCMRKIKEKTKKYLGRIGKAGLVITSLFCATSTCFGAVQDSKIATGTQNLITDLTNWLLILAKIAIICCVGVIVASGLINLIVGYYK